MSEIQIRRMDEIESWRQKAYTLSRTDRLGLLMLKSIDLIQTVHRDGLDENLTSDIESLSKERAKTMGQDEMRDDALRSVLYGMSASVCSMIESLMERHSVYFQSSAQSTAHMMSLRNSEIKTEPVDNSFLDQGNPIFAPESNNANEEESMKPIPGMIDSSTTSTTMEEMNELPGTSTSRKRNRSSIGKIGTEEPKSRRRETLDSNASGPFTCDKCNKQFETKKSFAHHELVHSGLMCAECGARLKNEDTLEKHFVDRHPGKPVQIKHGDGNLECSICDRTFDYPSTLEAHMRSHTGEKPFACDTCEATFKKSKQLVAHRRNVHGELQFECRECGDSFAMKTDLAKHKKEVHKTDE